MRIGIHGQPTTFELAAAREGAEALGHRVIWRSASDYRSGEVEPIFDAVLLSGTRLQGGMIAADYGAAGVPVLVLDYGYLRRVYRRADWATGHWQFGLGGLNWLPLVDLPDDRLRALELAPQPRRNGERVLVCGQHIGDPSHGLEAAGIAAWATRTIAELREITARPIVWRPHPDSPGIQVAADGVSTEPFAEALRNAWAVVTISSNSGHEALLAGVPVFCDPRAMYAALANRGLAALEEPFFPSPDQLWRYLSRLAYAQWTLEEVRTGVPIQFLLDACRGVWPACEPGSIVAPAPAAPPAVEPVRTTAARPGVPKGRGRARRAA